ncbi:MAG TPA: hypothetical protein VF974_02150 [Patescibacteria group bacterium]
MKNQTKIIAISLFGLIVSFGLVLSVVNPTLSKIDELNKAILIKIIEQKQLEEQITIFKNSQRDLARATGKQSISESVLKREDLQLAIQKIESAALATKVSESMAIVDETDPLKKGSVDKQLINGKSFITEVPYTLNVSSDFRQLIDFMRYMEHLPHFTEVSRISLQASGGSADSKGTFSHSGTIIGSIESVFFIQKK